MLKAILDSENVVVLAGHYELTDTGVTGRGFKTPLFTTETHRAVEIESLPANWRPNAWKLQPDGQWEFLNLPVLSTPRQVEQLQASIVADTQKRLDNFARTRNYDSILSAATYATSTVPKFRAEGQYAVEARDATWAALYALMNEVQTGTRPMPTGYADIEGDLPVLAWPELIQNT